ncbi:primosomal replication protein [Shewanella sp. 202IG2-18]|uniref:primosomal replication protein PriC n=1 Tax=Parashewanella hymeniacidonis TaxID=2807618 RepID=UPI00195F8488|nr:primosomal replication protein [Parashewanella hymeniacidonis]
MNQQQLIIKLREQLGRLEQEVLKHDSNLAQNEQKLLQNNGRFNSGLFHQNGGKLIACVHQIKHSINMLDKRLQAGINKDAIETSCLHIQDQFSAVKRALNTTAIDLKSERHKRSTARSSYLKRQQKKHNDSGFEWIASNVMQNSHQLYAELNKHLNWASRIEEKIQESNQKLDNCLARDKLKLQHEILDMHKRLGKCRQAISYIEDRIQLFERPNYKKDF